MAIQASKTCKVWILLNPSMCYSDCFWDTGRQIYAIVAVSGIPRDVPLFFLDFTEFSWLYYDILPTENLLPLQHGFSLPFIACLLGLHGTSNFSLLPLRARAVTVAQGLVSSLFSSWFSSFNTVPLKVTCWLSIPGRPWATNLQSLFLQDFSLFRLSCVCIVLAVIIPK